MSSFPFSGYVPLRFPGPPPPRADVVVVGGGVIGVMTAWHLAERGLSVVVCEKGRVGAEQSGRNWGWVRQQGRDPAELPIMMESLRIWQRLAQEVPGLGFTQSGVMYLAKTAREVADFEGWMVHARAHGLDTVMLGRAAVAERLGSSGGWTCGMWTASDARAEPWVAVPLLAAALAGKGAAVVEGCAVRALDLAGGCVAGVVTEAGRIACDAVVVAGGAWSRRFLGNAGVRIPQLSVLASVGATEAMPEVFPGNTADDAFAFRRRADGGYSIAPGTSHDIFIGPDAIASFAAYLPVLKKDFRSTRFRVAAPADYPDAWGTARTWGAGASPFEACRVLDPRPDTGALGRAQDAFARAFPALGRPRLRADWGGMIDLMPDLVPVIDQAGPQGLVVATGMSGHGFGIGPGIGRVVANMVTGRAVGHDLSRFRFARFSDGSRLAPGPSL